MKRAMTECPHCQESIEVVVDENRLRLKAIHPDLEAREGFRLMDEAFGKMNRAFNLIFGRGKG